MSKKWKIILAVVAAVVVLALAGSVVVTLAADNPTTPTSTSNPLFAKVATILGVTEKQLTDAFTQARTQLENQRIDQWLAQAVTDKKITQDEANKIKAWLAQKPNTQDTLKTWLDLRPQLANQDVFRGLLGAPRRMMGPIGIPGANNTDLLTKVASILSTAAGKTITVPQLKDAFTQAEKQMQAEAFDKALANAVTRGKLTQAEADQIKAWWKQKPAAMDKFAPNGVPGVPGLGPGGRMRGRGGMMRGRGGMMRGGMFQGIPGIKAPLPSTQTTQ